MNKLIFEVQCGIVRGAIEATGSGDAFRKIMNHIPPKKRSIARRGFSPLARFRVFDKRRNLRSTWLYQEPEALLKDKTDWKWP